MNKALVWVMVCLVIFSVVRKKVFAISFIDDFTTMDSSRWVFEQNEGEISVSESGIQLYSNKISFPFIYDKFDSRLIPNDGDFNLKIRFRYRDINSMGDGIGFGYFKGPEMDTLIEYGVWADTHLGFIYMKNDFRKQGVCSGLNMFNDNTNRENIQLGLNYLDWHIFEVERVGQIISFFIDRSATRNPLFSLVDIGCLGRNIFIGNNRTGGSYSWSTLEIDYVKVSDLSALPSNNKKVVILPGMGASWNPIGALGSSDPALIWQVPSFVDVYDNLLNAFEANGFTRGENLFLWGYDWRQPINLISQNFNGYLSGIIKPEDEIILVGHSLGGLVARWWYQANSNDSRVKNVISLGSPHFGTIDAYEAWNGGEVGGRGVSSILFNILILLNRNLAETKASVIKRVAPVVSNLQPVFDFAYRENNLISFAGMVETNSLLAQKNADFVDSLFGKMFTVGGKGFSTNHFLTLGERNFFDQRLGLWLDGRPINKISSFYGDGTVLSSSARLGSNYFELVSNHGDLPTTSIDQIMSILNLSRENINNKVSNNRENSLVFYIASPAHLEVNCDGYQTKSDSMGFAVVDIGLGFNKCQVSVVADGNGGRYKFLTGNTSNNDWSRFEGLVSEGEVDSYVFDNRGILVGGEDTYIIYRNYCQDLLRTYGGDTNLMNCVDYAEKKQASGLLDAIFAYRKDKRSTDISYEMIGKLIPLLGYQQINTQQAWWYLKNGQGMFSLVESVAQIKKSKQIDIDDFGVNSYLLAGDVFKPAAADFGLGRYDLVKARFELSKMILSQVW